MGGASAAAEVTAEVQAALADHAPTEALGLLEHELGRATFNVDHILEGALRGLRERWTSHPQPTATLDERPHLQPVTRAAVEVDEFAAPPQGPLPFTAGDLDGDGLIDAVVADGDRAMILSNTGDLTFSPSWREGPRFTSRFRALWAGDFDHDGRVDLLAQDTGLGLQVARGRGDGAFDLGPVSQRGGSTTLTPLRAWGLDPAWLIEADVASDGSGPRSTPCASMRARRFRSPLWCCSSAGERGR